MTNPKFDVVDVMIGDRGGLYIYVENKDGMATYDIQNREWYSDKGILAEKLNNEGWEPSVDVSSSKVTWDKLRKG
jgi:hypothetical protein